MLHEQAVCACEKVQASKLHAAQWTPALRKMTAKRAQTRAALFAICAGCSFAAFSPAHVAPRTET